MTSTIPPEIIAAVDGPRMMAHMEEFARWRKESGVPEELESLAYVEARMKEYGYATELILHDAYISLPGKAAVEMEGDTLRCITHSFSCSALEGGRTAGIVDLGDGSEEAFARHDVRGKFVLVDGIANPVMSRRASLAGAAGQVHVSPHEHTHEMCISPVWGSPTGDTVGNLPSTVVVTVPLDEGTAIRNRLRDRRNLELTVFAEVDTGWRKTPILVCDLVSNTGDDDEPFIFFTGHHDTWYYGVMDNGGANATMMEVGRVCAQNRDKWRRAMRIVFWSGHSQGRYSGSTWYADENWQELEKRALVHVNVDSTGGKGNTIVADTTAAAELRGLAVESIQEQADQTFTNRRMARAGDQSFWGIGVSSIYGNMSEQPATGETNASAAVFGGGARLGHGTGWWWHTPEDLLDKMDEDNLVRDTKIYLHTVWRLMTDPVLPLDWAEHGRYLGEELKHLDDDVGARFDLSTLIARAEALTDSAGRFNEAAATAGADQWGLLNETLIAVSRALVPLDYTECDRFEQDPAISAPIYPSLRPVRQMATVRPGSDEEKFLRVGAMRARNRLAFGLDQAISALDRAIDMTKKESYQ
ncbi:MAG: M28 family metallopeptidase [Alphaproteobacteria bacterium]|nr:M28 family metallopeptidase [Alphaproteobacteria bacterium]